MSSSEESDSSTDSSSEENFSSEEEVVSKKHKAPAKKLTKKAPVSRKKPVKAVSRKKQQEMSEEESSDGSDDSSSGSDSDSSDSSDDSDSEEEVATKKRRVKSSSSSSSAKKSSSSSSSKKSSSSSSSKHSSGNNIVKVKKIRDMDRLEEARKAYKWWEAKPLPDGLNWRTLEHCGVIFAPPHVRHNVPLLYDGKRVPLTIDQEELATFYASIPEDGPQLGAPKSRAVFQKNFFVDFKSTLTPGHVVQKFEKCDFSLIKAHLAQEKALRKAATEEEKAAKKLVKEAQAMQHGYALIDGRMEKVGNYNVEPPGLFRGRGEHPKTGVLKRRCYPESISINVSEGSAVPKCGLPGHAWQSVRHDPTVTWLSKWDENVMGQTKYVMLAASSSFKGKSDQEKYQKAIRLKGCIHRIRKDYTSKIKSKDKSDRQLGTAMWVIDILALRVGGEKGDDEADTVGCCSLRVEHLKFGGKNDADNYEIELEFLGKDSMLFRQNINFAQYGDVGKLVYNGLKSFVAGKSATDEVFETLTPTILNKHLNGLMSGLSAKVFRTYNASVTLEKELPTAEQLEGLSVQEKVIRFNAANREVAILCNHQKTVSKAAETMFENLNERLEILKSQRTDLISWLEMCKKGKENKIPLKEDDKDTVDRIGKMLKDALQQKESAVTTENKLKAGEAVENAKNAQRQDQRRRLLEKHMYKTTPNTSSVDGRIAKWNEDIRKLEVDIRNRDENKEVALGTSKINYIDPRISVAWCKRCEVPIDKVFAKTLRDKFNWAMAAEPNWKFE